jgi:hypothetical protein
MPVDFWQQSGQMTEWLALSLLLCEECEQVDQVVVVMEQVGEVY